jgi:acyl carrier protein
MKNKDVVEKVLNLVAQALNIGREFLSLESTSSDIDEWDSFGQIAIIVEIENYFEIILTKNEMFSFKSIFELVEIVLAKKTLYSDEVN